MKIRVLLVLALAWSSAVPADVDLQMTGHETGNGGDVIVCRDSSGNIKSVELLDYYEGETLRYIKRYLGRDDLSVEEKLEIALSRLELVSPKRAAHYRTEYQDFSKEALFLSDVVLTDIPDSQHVAIPKGCDIEQIAVQREPEFEQDRRYTINKDLWDLLDNDNKAGLILHEIIYREAIIYNASNSLSTRYFNSLLTSDRDHAKTLDEHIGILKQMKFLRTDFKGISLRLGYLKDGVFSPYNVDYWDSNTISAGFLDYKDAFFWGSFHVIAKRSQIKITFDKNGNLEKLDGVPHSDDWKVVHVKPNEDGSISTRMFKAVGAAEFSADKEIKSLFLVESDYFKVGEVTVEFAGFNQLRGKEAKMTFYPGFLVETGVLAKATVLPYADGTKREHPAGPVHFDMQGRVIE